MSKPYSEADFSAQIIDDRNWRFKEISDLKTAIRRADEGLQKVLLRALVTISYAHWEGYIKFSAKKFLEFVAIRKLKFDELDRQFLRNYFLPRLAGLYSSNVSVTERCKIVEEIVTSGEQRFGRVNDDLVNTRSNLSSEVFRDICIVCGVSFDEFSTHSTFIDIVLLKRRNAIAHGEETLISISDLDTICDDTIGLMRQFGDALENRVVLKAYRAA